MEAQLKVDQQMEENLLAGRGIVFNRVLEAASYQGFGDKIKLPSSCFTELSEQGSFDKGPLHFQLSVMHHEDLSTILVFAQLPSLALSSSYNFNSFLF